MSKVTADDVLTVIQDAIVLYDWAFNEILKKRDIISVDEQGNFYEKASTPVIEKIKKDLKAKEQANV